MVPEELAARLHEIGDAIANRASEIERLARERSFPGEESINIGIGALRDDALLLHTTAEALETGAVSWPTALGHVAEKAGALFEERRR